jgi:hypothetical protein
VIRTGADGATVAGGFSNLILNAAYSSTIGGGEYNSVDGGSWGTVAGGVSNSVTADYGVVSGGWDGTASGQFASVPGGAGNVAAGDYSMAAGRRAKANHIGAFVWGDSAFADFASTGADQFLIRAAGGVGVGVTAPATPLHVDGGTDVGVAGGGHFQVGASGGQNIAMDGNEIMARDNGAAATLHLNADGGNVEVFPSGPGLLGVGTNAPLATLHVEEDAADDPLRVRVAGDTKLIVKNDGKVGIETASPSEKLDVGGNVRCVSLIETSDARYKQEVRELEGALDAVLALRGVSYEWDPEAFPRGGPGRKLGFLAQEVRAILPEAVREDQEGMLAVSYSSVVPVLVEAVREQQGVIEDLESRLALLESLLVD